MSVRLENVSCLYNADTAMVVSAVSDVSFTIKKGEVVALVGHTGSGKSTLAQLICGLVSADSGNVYLDDFCITTKRRPKAVELVKRVGMVFQYPEHQLFEETVREELAYAPTNLGWEDATIKRATKRIMKQLNMDEEFLRRNPYELSGGEKRKVTLASVLITNPPILLLDEPFVGLDVVAQVEFMSMVRAWLKDNGSTIICISHDRDALAKFCTRMMVMQAGNLVLDAPIKDAFNQVDLLAECGIDLPVAKLALLELQKNGADIATDAITIEEAAAVINKWRLEVD